MSGKNQFPVVFNWQSANPVTGFVPNPNQSGSLPSGVVAGTMATTATIYSQIVDVSKMDNIGLEYTFTGTPTGTLSILVSNSGSNFYAITPSPALTQPAGAAGGFITGINQIQFKYLLLKYVNASGSGTLTVYGQLKDLN